MASTAARPETTNRQLEATPEVLERLEHVRGEQLHIVGPRRGLFAGTADAIRDVAAYRSLLYLLIKRDIKSRYKDSALGFLWSFLRPLSTLLVYYLAIGKFLGAARSTPDFAIFMLSGLMVWQLFLEVVSGGTSGIVGNSGLIKKVYLPKEVFPLSILGSALFNFVMQLLVVVAALLILGHIPTGFRLLYFPAALAVIIVWALAVAMALSAATVYLRDFLHIIDIVLMVWFWMCPVVYPWKFVATNVAPWMAEVYLANPVTIAVLGMQRALWVAGTNEPTPAHLLTRMLISFLVGLAALWAAQRFFARLQANFAQEL